jgi:hypothetical protein
MRSRAWIAGLVMVGSVVTATLAGSGPGTGWRAAGGTFTPESRTVDGWQGLGNFWGGLSLKQGVVGTKWFQKSIDVMPPDGGFWNALTVHYEAEKGTNLVAVYVWRQRLENPLSGYTPGSSELIGSFVTSANYSPGNSGPGTVCLRDAIVDPPSDGMPYTYYVEVGLHHYPTNPDVSQPVLHGVAVTQSADCPTP